MAEWSETRMPLTLQEAQLVSWKVFRKISGRLDASGEKLANPLVMVADILEKTGKTAATVKGLEGLKSPDETKTKEVLAGELSDLLYTVFVLAEHYGLNLEDTFLEHVNDYLLQFITD
jgi:NTP pyrophosphatase (non-canonical NTP hydrolase)